MGPLKVALLKIVETFREVDFSKKVWRSVGNLRAKIRRSSYEVPMRFLWSSYADRWQVGGKKGGIMNKFPLAILWLRDRYIYHFFANISRFTCVCEKKAVPSRAPTSFVNSGAHLEATFARRSPYTRSFEIFAKTVWPYHPLPNTSLSSELERVLYSVWDRWNLSFFCKYFSLCLRMCIFCSTFVR